MHLPETTAGSAPPLRIDEPFGHHPPSSKIERGWAQAPPGHALTRSRTERYDPSCSLLYSPVVYEFSPVQVEPTEPDDDWLRGALVDFVRGEFTAEKSAVAPTRFRPEVVGSRTVGMEVLSDYLAQCELDLVYGAALGAIKENQELEIAEAVLEVVTHPQLGHKANATNLDREQWIQHVRRQIDKRDRLLFVIPACPFKDQNPLRTLSGPAHPDAGEVAFLVSLHILSLALYQVHPFGADWVILADGVLYADVFGIPAHEALRYRETLCYLRTALNLQGTVSIIDLSELIAHFTAAAGEDRVESIKERIRALVRSAGQDGPVEEAVRTLRRGMRKNLATRSLLERYEIHDVWTLLNVTDRSAVPSALLDDWDALEIRAARAAEEYAAINLMLRWFDVITRCFPDSLRATVHPKPGQLAVRSNGSAYPWNATAVRTQARTAAELIRSESLQNLAEKGPFVAVNLGHAEHGGLLYLEATV